MFDGTGRVGTGFSGAASWVQLAAQLIVIARVVSAAVNTAAHWLALRFGGGIFLRRGMHSESVLI